MKANQRIKTEIKKLHQGKKPGPEFSLIQTCSKIQRHKPVPVPTLRWRFIICLSAALFAIVLFSYSSISAMELKAMGSNEHGQLGDGTWTNRSTPVPVTSWVAELTAGASFSMFIKGDKSLWATGGNGYGQLGDGTTTWRNTPLQVAEDVADAAAGLYHSLIDLSISSRDKRPGHKVHQEPYQQIMKAVMGQQSGEEIV